MRYTFAQVKLKATKRWVHNGRKRQETRTFMQTINPYNKNEYGNPKHHDEIMVELIAERNKWLAEKCDA
jgi:hypothetical protein